MVAAMSKDDPLAFTLVSFLQLIIITTFILIRKNFYTNFFKDSPLQFNMLNFHIILLIHICCLILEFQIRGPPAVFVWHALISQVNTSMIYFLD